MNISTNNHKWMHHLLLLALLWGAMGSSIHAQNRSINFENDSLVSHALNKAREQGKLVMVDCYTTWCVPCKALSKLVFTVDSVADFINERMVSVKLNMETHQGKEYIRKYEVGAYPTILFLNPDGGLQFKFTGYIPANEFMKKVREGLNPTNKVAEMNTRYAAGERSGDFIRPYIMLKMELSEFNDAMRIDTTYLKSLSREEAASKENWVLFGHSHYQTRLSGPGTYAQRYLFAHFDDFNKTIQRDTLSQRINDMCCEMAEWVMQGWYKRHVGELDAKEFDTYLQQVKSMDIENKECCVALIDMCKHIALNDKKQVGKILLENVDRMNAQFQQTIFAYCNYGGYSKAPYMKEIAAKVIEMNLLPNLVSFLRSIVPDAEAAEMRYEQPQLQKQIGTLFVVPFFHPTKSLCWWYEETPDKQKTYYAYDADTRSKFALYDENAILAELHVQDASNLSYSPEFDDEGIVSNFSYQFKPYVYDRTHKTIREAEEKSIHYPIWGASPDSLFVLGQDGYNLTLTNHKTGHQTLLSTNGSERNAYSTADTHWFGNHSLYTLKEDKRSVRQLATLNQLYTVPTAINYDYELPGDTGIAHQDLYIIDVERGDSTARMVNLHKWKDDQIQLLQAAGCKNQIFFIRRKRTRDIMELCRFDLNSRTIKVIVHEESKPIINEDMFSCKIVNEGNDIFFWSDRTGWGHYYHYDRNGKLLNAVTKGHWTAGRITYIDSKSKQIYLYGFGRENNVNPNFQQLYRVGFDGKNIKRLTPENKSHNVFISKNGKFLIDNSSTINCAPQVIARSTSGELKDTICTPDISRLLDYGWKMPEPFKVMAADGKTELYGIMWKPFNFDPNKKYPIISQVYPGPFTDTVWSDFTVLDKYDNTALAQRGFIVVCFGHRGSSPHRSAAYYKYGHGNLRDYALADDKAGIEQLGKMYSYIDTTRVGIVGHSGGGMMAATALMTYPDFYKAAVASSGNYDNRIYNRTWGETYQGIGKELDFQVATVQDLVKNLKGHLMIVTGDGDQNVHPAHTMRLVNELILKKKDFDLLVLPNQGHHYEEPYERYFQQKKRDFFARWLK